MVQAGSYEHSAAPAVRLVQAGVALETAKSCATAVQARDGTPTGVKRTLRCRPRPAHTLNPQGRPPRRFYRTAEENAETSSARRVARGRRRGKTVKLRQRSLLCPRQHAPVCQERRNAGGGGGYRPESAGAGRRHGAPARRARNGRYRTRHVVHNAAVRALAAVASER